MIFTYSNWFYIGTYADVDTDELDYDAENLAPLIGAGATNTTGLELVQMEERDNDDGGISDDDRNGTAGDRVRYTRGGTSFTDVSPNTTTRARITITLSDGSTLTQDALVIQMDNGDTFVGDLLNNGTMDNLNVQGIEINNIVTHNNRGYFDSQSIENSMVDCFTRGTEITTREGMVKVEDLEVDDSILTRDHGFQQLRWIGNKKVPIAGSVAPVFFPAGSIGNQRDISVSPQHRILIKDPVCEVLFGELEVLVPAIHLLEAPGVRLWHSGTVEYFHLLFDRHEIIYSNECWSESFHPGDTALRSLSPAARQEVLDLFPEITNVASSSNRYLARRSLREDEARVLSAETFRTPLLNAV